MKLVIIEDDANFATLLAHALEGLTESVIVVSNWTDARANMTGRDVAWIDLRLAPDTHEAESLREITQLREQRSDLVIVVGSGYITPEMRAKLDQAGVDACFYKDSSFSAKQVASLIVAAIMKANMRNNESTRRLLVRALQWMQDRFPLETPTPNTP